MSFSDISTAIRMRNLISDISTDVVNRIRPEPKIGKVYSVNTVSQMAEVLFPGETVNSLVEVHFSVHMTPSVSMDKNFGTLGYSSPADIVRVAGKPGSYYIIDYISGVPNDTGWLTPTFENGWVNYNATVFEVLRYRRKSGIVYVQGLVRAGTAGSSITTLPVGFRTVGLESLWPSVTDTGAGRVDLFPDGRIAHAAGGTQFVSLNLEYPADA